MQGKVSGQLRVFFYDTEAGSKDVGPVVVPCTSKPTGKPLICMTLMPPSQCRYHAALSLNLAESAVRSSTVHAVLVDSPATAMLSCENQQVVHVNAIMSIR